MTIRTTLLILGLALSPTLTFAECVGQHTPKISASTCAEGTTWDSATSTCVPQSTS